MAFRDIPDEDLQAFAEGRKSLDDLAAMAGISKQAVSQALRRRGIRRGASVASPAPSVPAGPQNAPTTLQPAPAMPAVAPETFTEMVTAELTNLAALVVIEGGKLLRGEKAAVGASALKAIMAAAAMARAELEASGILEDGREELESFTVNVMTKAEAEAHQDSLDAEEADADDLEAPDQDGDKDEPTALSPAGSDALRGQLQAIASARGAAGLRALAVRLGIPAGRTADSLIAGLLDHALQHPEALAVIRDAT